ncbi:MAG TPA: alpha/beta hydrolase [Paracoccaceae bacterium]|nr:alpha/beta hydrolase [Paracoccaceae bacterium]
MRRFTTSDGLSLAYRDEGAGFPVLCLAGLTRNGVDFDPVLAAFGAEARTIRLDSRGRGASDRDPDFRNYTPAIEARDALELLDHLGLAQVAVIGTSRGGILAMLMALAAKERLLGIVLNDVGPVIEPAGIEAILTYVGLRPPEATLDALAARLAAQNATDFPGVGPARWRHWAAGVYAETPDGLELRYDPKIRDAILAQIEAGPPPDLWPVFDAFEGIPLALLRGANSRLLSAAAAAEMRARRPDMICAEIPGRGHAPFLDEPESLAAIGSLLALARAVPSP